MSIRSLAFFNRSPCAVSGDQADTDTVTAQGLHALTRHARNGDFYLAKNGDLDPATSGDFLTATDTPNPLGSARSAMPFLETAQHTTTCYFKLNDVLSR
jgi:hypothetical protein